MIIYNQKGRKSPSNKSLFRGLNMIDINLLKKNFPDAYDSFDEAWEANQIK